MATSSVSEEASLRMSKLREALRMALDASLRSVGVGGFADALPRLSSRHKDTVEHLAVQLLSKLREHIEVRLAQPSVLQFRASRWPPNLPARRAAGRV